MQVIALLFLLVSGVSFGSHEVGDMVSYRVDISGPLGRNVFQDTLEILAYDGRDNKWLIQIFRRYQNGQYQIRRDWKKDRDLKDQNYIEKLLKNCKPDADVDRQLATIFVRAGKFETCMEEYFSDKKRGSLNIGLVPIHGIVRQDLVNPNDGVRVRLELYQYRFARPR